MWVGMTKKPSKSTMEAKLDKIVSKIVRSRGSCEKCGLSDYSKLQAAHIYSRTYRSVRWDLLNILCLCAGCHFHGHKNPVLFTEFVKQHLGDVNFEALKMHATPTKKWILEDMITYYTSLENLFKGEVE